VETGTAAPAAKISEASLEFSIGKPNHGMAPHTKAQCTACHSPNGAPDACLTCHVYHMKKLILAPFGRSENFSETLTRW
jgi:hypothetical protein